ncbi:hypothetical protein [uncultured Cyclobacterium sp.]|uniref:hypothetical protein n=1 Tax=uncultured Cyclobacterium sp. TaxID=453820 RepID=UPI0030ECDC53|tara:strand:+ start:19632 stop:20165 length:534 start_codon:yes stop_codon:yes gene_type:complete
MSPIQPTSKFQNTKQAIIISLILFIPFTIKSLEPGLEIYPAIIFPAGASTLNVQDEFRTFERYEVYGLNDSLVKLNTQTLLKNIPSHYFHSVLKGNFGLEPYKNTFLIPFTIKEVFEGNNLNPEKVKASKLWLSTNLNDAGYTDSIFVLRKIKKKYNLNRKQIESETLIYEKTFPLY